jgi:hypothetical protein
MTTGIIYRTSFDSHYPLATVVLQPLQSTSHRCPSFTAIRQPHHFPATDANSLPLLSTCRYCQLPLPATSTRAHNQIFIYVTLDIFPSELTYFFALVSHRIIMSFINSSNGRAHYCPHGIHCHKK